MKRYLASFYRARWLYVFVLLVLLVGAAVGTYVQSRMQFESTARVWVEKAPLQTILDQNNQPISGYTPPPAQLQADKLYQLVQTDSFMLNVVKASSLSTQLTGDPDGDSRMLAKTRAKLAVGMLGPNTMGITYTCSDPPVCQQVVQATIDSYRTWLLQAQIDQSSIEVLFYQGQLKNYQDQLDAATQRSDEYQRAHPHPEPASNEYLESQRLQDEVKSAQSLYSATKSRIDQASIVQNLSDRSGQSEFQVLDKPTVPQRPAAGLSKILKLFGIGAAASLGVVIAAIFFRTLFDTSIRSSEDLGRLTDIPVVQVIPRIAQPKKGRKPEEPGPGAATLSIATALPGPSDD